LTPDIHPQAERFRLDTISLRGVEGLLRSAGFDIASHPEPEVFVCQKSTTEPEWEGLALIEQRVL